MRSVATDVWHGLSVSVCETAMYPANRLDRSRYRLACGVGWAVVTM